ncbi:MAG: LCP family protein [Caldilineaceae bacterium]|nr:LCP family protein [Caldilineaceae bacterium]
MQNRMSISSKLRLFIPVLLILSIVTSVLPLPVTSGTALAQAADDRPLPPIKPRLLIAPQPTPTPVPVQMPAAPTAPAMAELMAKIDLNVPSPAWQNTENFLILGTDRRGNEGVWRTDVIMVVGLDRQNGRAAVLSIPRDLYVEIPNYGMQRINRADYLGEKEINIEGGGPALISQILKNTLGIETTHWVRVEMQGFEALVDAIGGVTVHLDCPFFEPILNLDTNQWEYFTLPAGDVLMDGRTAHWFTRLRLRESDIGRARRQRQFLWALRNQLVSTNLLARFPELWSALNGLFATDLSLLQIVDLVRVGITFDATNVHAAGITMQQLQPITTESGAAVLQINNPYLVRAVIDGIWDAQPMSDTNRQSDSAACAPVPQGVPVVPYNSVVNAQTTPADATATPEPEAAPTNE